MGKPVFAFAVLMLVASLIPACGGGGSGSAGAAPPPVVQTPTSENKIYELATTGPHLITGNSVANMVRNITFAPSSPTEIEWVEVEGRGLFYGPTFPQLHVYFYIGSQLVSQRVMNPIAASVYRGFRLRFFPDWGTFVGLPPQYPADGTYNVRIIFVTPSATNGSVDNLKVRVSTVENPTILLNSPLIAG